MINRSTPATHGPAIAVALLASALFATPAGAEDFSSTNIQLATTGSAKQDVFNGTGTENERLSVFRAEHYGTWSYGDNYMVLDLFNGKKVGGTSAGSFGSDTNHQSFFVYQPRISLSKVTGSTIGVGIVKDVAVTYRREQASYANFHSDSYGLSVDLAVPGTVFFEQDFMLRKSSADKGTKWLSRTVWLAPFNVGGVGLHLDGLVLIKSTENFGTNLFAQIDLLGDVAAKGRLQVGLRLETARYKLPTGNLYSRTTPLLMAKLSF
jgi:nucleoside-specific outer membrane channel protein Tsx